MRLDSLNLYTEALYASASFSALASDGTFLAAARVGQRSTPTGCGVISLGIEGAVHQSYGGEPLCLILRAT